jgi:hypothetical protein
MNYTEEVYLNVSSTTTAANSYLIVNPTGNSTNSSRSEVSIAGILIAATAGYFLAPLIGAVAVAGAIVGGILEVATGIVEKVFNPSKW